MTAPTIEQAIRTLGHHRAFRPHDSGFGWRLVAQLRADRPLTGDLRAKAYRLIQSYGMELAAAGIAVGDIVYDESSLDVQPPAPENLKTRPEATVDDRLGLILLKTDFELKPVVQQLPGALWKSALKRWSVPATPAGALAVAESLMHLGLITDGNFDFLLKTAQSGRAAQIKRTDEGLPEVPGSKTKAWNHQKQAFWFVRELPAAQLDMEMGTGKSKVVCDVVHDSGAQSVMIVCPERVVGVWPKQFGLHSGGEKHIIDPRRQNRKGEWELLPIAKRVELYEHALHDCRCGLPHVLLTNYAAAAHEPFKSWSVRQHLDYLVYDESHRLRSHSGVWSRWAAKMQKRADRRLGGTGTLQSQTPLDVFGQFRALDPGIFGTSYTSFERRYAIKGGYGGYQVLGYQREDDLAAKVASITYRAGEEVLDLPEMLPEVRVEGQLSPRAHKAYVELEAQLYAEIARELADGSSVQDAVTVDNVLTRILRCQQITGGALPLDSGEVEEIDTAKAALLMEELEDIGSSEPVVVFARFHHDLDKIRQVAEKLGRPYGELSGRSSAALASDATLSKDITIAGVQIQSGGTGVDFTRSAFGIYYSVGHSLGDYLQSRKRLQRPGQTRRVRFRHLVMQGTIDEDIYEALADRQSVTDRIGAKVRALQAAS